MGSDTDQQNPVIGHDARVGIIGAGRLGSSIATAMDRAGYRIAALSSSRAEHRNRVASRFKQASGYDDPALVAADCDVIFITTSDSAIQSVAESVQWRNGQYVIHCSGATPVSALATAAISGAFVGGFHPLQTFPSSDSADSLDGITFGIEAADPTLAIWLRELASNLGGRTYMLTAEQRPAYHAAAVTACGLMAGLVGLAAEIWASKSDVSRHQAVDALVPLVKTTANSIAKNGLPNALTGPYVRGDVETIRTHAEVTTAASAEIGAAYTSVALAALHIASEQGNLSSDAERSIREILKTALAANCEIIEKA